LLLVGPTAAAATNVSVQVSPDGGGNWYATALTYQGPFAATNVYRFDGWTNWAQASANTQLLWRVKTTNLVSGVELHGISVLGR
jgi:hypothetical protein